MARIDEAARLPYNGGRPLLQTFGYPVRLQQIITKRDLVHEPARKTVPQVKGRYNHLLPRQLSRRQTRWLDLEGISKVESVEEGA